MQQRNKKIIAVLPAYNAARTLEKTVNDISRQWVDEIILVDDASCDNTVAIAKNLGLKIFVHPENRGYGGNQKTCYREALNLGADIAVMVHPDHQYDPRLVPELVKPLLAGEADAVFGSRMMVPKNALAGGMPCWKFLANIFLTFIENMILGLRLTEYHSGFRAYSRRTLEIILFEKNSDDFVFDTEIIVQMKLAGLKILEIPITTRYFSEASQISFKRSVEYGISILIVMGKYLLHKLRIKRFRQFFPKIKNVAAECSNCGDKNSSVVFPATININDVVRENAYRITDSVSGSHDNIYRCHSCGIYFIDRAKFVGDFERYYSNQELDKDYIKDEAGRRKAFGKMISFIKNIQNKNGAKLLDVGCGPGFFLIEAQKKGFEVYGIEPSLEACKFAKEKFKLKNIVCGFGVNLSDDFKRQFDIISALDVIEHVPDPKQFLKNIHGKLSAEGLAVITTPLIDSSFARLLGKRWYALLPSHLTYFTEDSFKDICEAAGLTVIRKRFHTKYLSLNYLIKRLFKKSDINLPNFINFVIPINFYDEAEFYLKKK